MCLSYIFESIDISALSFRLSVWLSTEAVAFFHSPVLPFFPPCLLLLSRLISIEETLSARLSKLENYGFDQLVSQRNWYHLLKEKSGFWGTRLSRRDVRGRIYEGCMGEVANRMSGGSFCGGRWGYLPFRHHDNRYSADWIRLCPGLSENSEDGNSCPKPHKAAHFDWSRGKSGQQWDWDYKPEYGCHHVETYGFKWKLMISETRMDRENKAVKGMQRVAPKDTTKFNLIFSGTPVPAGFGQGHAG